MTTADQLDIIAVAVGNTRTRCGLFRGQDLEESASHDNREPEAVGEAIVALASKAAPGVPVVFASVSPDVADRIEQRVERLIPSHPRYRVGRDLPIDMRHTLDDDSTVGHDRLMSALGAFRRTGQACVIVDVGTAVTVDFIDGDGTFHGGAIAPGVAMMLRALHEGTAQLPAVEYRRPDAARGPFGKDTAHAMMLGVTSAVRGLVRDLAERYAEYYEGYPQIIATGGDMGVLEHDELIEHFVPDLQLIGIRACCADALARSGGPGDGHD